MVSAPIVQRQQGRFYSRLDREVAHANGSDLARFEEVLHLRPSFVDRYGVKFYLPGWDRELFPDRAYIIPVSRLSSEMDRVTVAPESAQGTGLWIRYWEGISGETYVRISRLVYQINVVETERLQAILEKLFNPTRMVKPTNKGRLANSHHPTKRRIREFRRDEQLPSRNPRLGDLFANMLLRACAKVAKK